MKRKILFLGCGNMGEAILASLKASALSKKLDFFILEKDKRKEKKLTKKYKAKKFKSVKHDIIILAVKPQNKFEAVELLKNIKFRVLITILAGVKISFFEKHLGKIPVMRVMPNLGVKAGKGVAGIYANSRLKNKNLKNLRNLCEKIFTSCGIVVPVKKEQDLDRITAISGSGPAYVCYFLEALIEAAQKLNFKKKTALEISLATFEGAIEVLKKLSMEPKNLRIAVTSPKGTTHEAISVFERRNLKKIILTACSKAFKRAVELGRSK